MGIKKKAEENICVWRANLGHQHIWYKSKHKYLSLLSLTEVILFRITLSETQKYEIFQVSFYVRPLWLSYSIPAQERLIT